MSNFQQIGPKITPIFLKVIEYLTKQFFCFQSRENVCGPSVFVHLRASNLDQLHLDLGLVLNLELDQDQGFKQYLGMSVK